MYDFIIKFLKKYFIPIIVGFILAWIYYKFSIINLYYILGFIIISFIVIFVLYYSLLRYLKKTNLNQYYFYKKPDNVGFFWILEYIYDLFQESKSTFPKKQQKLINLYIVFFMIYKSFTFSLLVLVVSFIIMQLVNTV